MENEKKLAPKEAKPAVANTEILAILQKMQDEIAGLKTENQRLQFAADKGRLQNYDERQKGSITRVLRVREYDGKIVVGWKSSRDYVEKINGIWHEDQRITLYFWDETQQENVLLKSFENNFVAQNAKILKTTKEGDEGLRTFKVELIGEKYNGKQLEIS